MRPLSHIAMYYVPTSLTHNSRQPRIASWRRQCSHNGSDGGGEAAATAPAILNWVLLVMTMSTAYFQAMNFDHAIQLHQHCYLPRRPMSPQYDSSGIDLPQ